MIAWMRPKHQPPAKRITHWMRIPPRILTGDPTAHSECGMVYRRLSQMVFDVTARKCEKCLERQKAEEDGNADSRS